MYFKKGRFAWKMIFVFILFLIGFPCFGPPVKSQTPGLSPEKLGPSADVPFIDIHNHLITEGGSRSMPDFPGAVKTALAAMDKLGVQKMLILPPPFPPGHRGQYTADAFLRVIKKYPDRFGFLDGGGSLNIIIQQAAQEQTLSPGLKARFEKEAEQILAQGALGFGEITALHFSLHPDHPFMEAPPDQPLFLLLSDIAARYDVPIDLHMEAVPEDMPLPDDPRLESANNPKTLTANIPALERLLDHNPKVRIIWDHVGWCNTGRRTPALCRELLSRHTNLYMSFKISPDSNPACRPLMPESEIKPEWLELIKDFPDRFLIGTDQFYASPGSNVRGGPQRNSGTKILLSWLPRDLALKVAIENPKAVFKLN